jgi:hypothetical protein
LCFGCIFDVSIKIVNHGSCRGHTARALARWQHLVAKHEAIDALHWAMCLAPYRPGGMAVKIVVNSPAFFDIVNSVVTHNHS